GLSRLAASVAGQGRMTSAERLFAEAVRAAERADAQADPPTAAAR
ncbi:MAG: hypothetical protein JWO31_1379, partial [Phycisphaerales bacterium]|nr:hypothetical protein [Phycisphaerales bacterium]